MNEQLQQEIQNLQTQADIFTNDLARIAGDEAQKGTYDALTAELETVKGKIAAKQAQADEVQTAVLSNQIPTQIDLGDGEILDIYDYTTTPESGDMLLAYINERIAAITAQATIQAQAYQQELKEEKDRNTALSTENFQKGIDLADMTAKRDAAAKELEDANAKIAQLEQEAETTRAQIVKPVETNMTANLREMAERAKAARPKIYDLQWQDEPKRTMYTAKMADTGESIVFKRLELGKYNVLTDDEALQFRNELPPTTTPSAPTETEPVESDPVPDRPLDNGTVEPPVVPFQDGETQVSTVDAAGNGEPTVPEVVAPTRSIEKRLQELEAVVGAIRIKVGV